LHVGTFRLRRHHHRRQLGPVDVLRARERRGRFDRVDADDRLAKALFVGADRLRKVGERRLVTKRGAQFFARRFELASHPANTSRPRILAQRVDHRAADASLGEGLELDAARIIEAVCRVDQSDHAVLDQIAQVDRMRHRCRHPSRERLDKRQSRFNPIRLTRLTVSFRYRGFHRCLFSVA